MKTLLCVLFRLFAVGSWGATPRLAWDANPVEEAVTGYKVYYGLVSRYAMGWVAYTTVIDVGNVLESDPITVSDVVTTYFAVTAYNAYALESDYSLEVPYVPGQSGGLLRLAFSYGSGSSLFSTGAGSATFQ